MKYGHCLFVGWLVGVSLIVSESLVLKNSSKYRRYVVSRYQTTERDGVTTTSIRKREATRRYGNLEERDTGNRSCSNLPQKPVHAKSLECSYGQTTGGCTAICNHRFLFPSGSRQASSFCTNGHWSPEMPSSCILSERNPTFTGSCKITPPIPSQGSSISCQSSTRHANCEASCSYGYLFPNGGTSMEASCSNGTWSPVMPEACEPQPDISLNVSCNVLPPYPNNARGVSCRHNFEWGNCQAFCRPGNVSPSGTNKAAASCVNGYWSLDLWLCQPSSTNSVHSLRHLDSEEIYF